AEASRASFSMSRQRTIAPSLTPSAAILISRRSGSLRRSTRSEGVASRKASIGIRLWPPAIAFASPSREASSATASASVVGHAYSSGGNFMDSMFRLERRRVQLTLDFPCGQRSRLICVLDELPQPRRRQRQVARRNAERGERVGDRVCDHAADRNDAALARALGAERIVRRGFLFERDHA